MQGSGLPRFATTPPPQFANCKLRQSQLRHAKRKMQRGNGGAKQFQTERPWEGGRDWRSKAWISPHPWSPSLLTPPPRAPGSALAKVGRKRELERRPGGRAPPRPRSYCSGTARGRATRGPPQEIPRAEWARGPAPFLSWGSVCVRGGVLASETRPLKLPHPQRQRILVDGEEWSV